MDNCKDEIAPKPEKKKILKIHTFKRLIDQSENTPLENVKTTPKQEKGTKKIALNFILTLYVNEISISSKMSNILYETVLTFETLKSLSKFFLFLI